MIVLIRHAEAEGAAGRFTGRRTDPPLSAAGLAQAEALAEALADSGLAALAASPLRRARQTAAPLAAALGLPVATVDGLAEIDMGDWDGRPRAEIRAQDPTGWAARGADFAHFRPPGGETFAEVQARAVAALDAMAHGPQPVAAVTHAGVIRTLACHVLGIPLGHLFRLAPEHARCMVLRPAHDEFILCGFNLPRLDATS